MKEDMQVVTTDYFGLALAQEQLNKQIITLDETIIDLEERVEPILCARHEISDGKEVESKASEHSTIVQEIIDQTQTITNLIGKLKYIIKNMEL